MTEEEITSIYLEDKEKLQVETDKEREREKNAEKQRAIDYRLTFSTEHGFRVLQDIGAFCHLLESTYSRGDTHESALREGERNVMIYVLSKLSGELRAKLIGG